MAIKELFNKLAGKRPSQIFKKNIGEFITEQGKHTDETIVKTGDVLAWQFTKRNFNNGVPRLIRENTNIILWSQYGGDIIGGEIKTLKETIYISEGDYFIIDINGEVYLYKSDTRTLDDLNFTIINREEG